MLSNHDNDWKRHGGVVQRAFRSFAEASTLTLRKNASVSAQGALSGHFCIPMSTKRILEENLLLMSSRVLFYVHAGQIYWQNPWYRIGWCCLTSQSRLFWNSFTEEAAFWLGAYTCNVWNNHVWKTQIEQAALYCWTFPLHISKYIFTKIGKNHMTQAAHFS